MLEKAFFEVCEDSQPAKSIYVSLYRVDPYYGGPEEGGWWGSDTNLVAYQHYDTQLAADAALEQVKLLADEQNEQEKKAYGDQCLRESEWLDARGLDDGFLREPDGETTFWVTIEKSPGQYVSTGARGYS